LRIKPSIYSIIGVSCSISFIITILTDILGFTFAIYLLVRITVIIAIDTTVGFDL
jgi:hypothetical protein